MRFEHCLPLRVHDFSRAESTEVHVTVRPRYPAMEPAGDKQAHWKPASLRSDDGATTLIGKGLICRLGKLSSWSR